MAITKSEFAKKRIRKSFSVSDSSTLLISAKSFMPWMAVKDITSLSARLAQQFLKVNNELFRNLGVSGSIDYDGSKIKILLRSGIFVGAVPLISPTSGQPDYGLIISPRFGWPGLGNILAQTGWKVIPTLLTRLPLLPQSDRNVPRWVLSGTVLFRLEALLRKLDRTFVLKDLDLSAPRGQVKWDQYAYTRLSRMKALNVPCRVPDLEQHRELKAAIHFTLRKQLSSLETQRTAGVVVTRLIELCHSLIARVKSLHPKVPTAQQLHSWSRTKLGHNVLRDGLEAIEWTLEERGLAGLSDLRGLPWIMSMDSFYESWVETILELYTRKYGGVLRSGRKRETITAIAWDKPFFGSQKYLLPDFVIDHPSGPIVVDAKYKEHWEDMQVSSWIQLEDEIRAGHRQDLHQILAYSALFDKAPITACLVYPCREKTWQSLKERRRLSHHAQIQAGNRRIDLVLATFPLSGTPVEIIEAFGPELFRQGKL